MPSRHRWLCDEVGEYGCMIFSIFAANPLPHVPVAKQKKERNRKGKKASLKSCA